MVVPKAGHSVVPKVADLAARLADRSDSKSAVCLVGQMVVELAECWAAQTVDYLAEQTVDC